MPTTVRTEAQVRAEQARDEREPRITVRFERQYYEAIDRARGDKSRHAWITDTVIKALKSAQKKTPAK